MLSYEPVIVTCIVSFLGYSQAKFINKAWRKHAKQFAQGKEKIGLYLMNHIFGDKIPKVIDAKSFSDPELATVYAYTMIYKKPFDYNLFQLAAGMTYRKKLIDKYIIDNKNCVAVTREIHKFCGYDHSAIVNFIELVARRDLNAAKKIIHNYLSDDTSLYIRIIMRINA